MASSLSRIGRLCTVTALCVLAGGSALAASNSAAAFRWKSRVYLNTEFEAVSASDAEYTISAQFLPTYELPNFGVIFAANGSNGHKLMLGQQIDYQKTCTNPSDDSTCYETWTPAVSLVVDQTEVVQRVNPVAQNGVKVGQWNHVAVTFKKGTGWRVILNGIIVISVPDNGFRPFAKMTLGNSSTYDPHKQFYGLIDDVAIFTKAFTTEMISSQLLTVTRLPANMANMKYGWSFDGTQTLTSASVIPTYGSNAAAVSVSTGHSSNDVNQIPKPVQSAIYKLPIPVEYEAYVVKGNSSDHHSGPWAFCWDFIYAGKRSDSTTTRRPFADAGKAYELNLASGKGRKLVAAADGEVVQANWTVVEGDGNGIPNSVQIRHAAGEYSSYYHFTTNSFPELFPWAGKTIKLPSASLASVEASPLGTYYPLVSSGQAIGGEGGTGMGECEDCFHLHYGVLDEPDIAAEFPDRITRPTEFVDYEYSYDRLTWMPGTGVPQVGTYVRRMAEPVTASPSSGCSKFDPNQGMYANRPIYSCDGRFRLYLQSDSNLVLGMKDNKGEYSIPLWTTGSKTIGKDGYTLVMEGDGDLAYYNSRGDRIWHTGTSGNRGAYFRLQNDGNMVVYREDGVPLWASNTAGH